jgi:hypothetical protein
MVAIKNGSQLRIANIGDSGFMVIRFTDENEGGIAYCANKSTE